MNSFGNIFRITSFGESHGRGIGVIIDGCPAGLELDMEMIQVELDRRRPGQSKITTQRKESDIFEIQSGVVGNVTSGAPMSFFVPNEDQRSKDYDHLARAFRPSHADYTYTTKYGLRDHRGGGRSSARETVARVIAGAVAKQLLARECGIIINAWVHSVGELSLEENPTKMELETEAEKMVRCPDPAMAAQMVSFIQSVRKAGDSVGGVIRCNISNVPAGLGSPVFGKLHAVLGGAMLGINAVKGVEFGSGFAGTKMRGSTHNDHFYVEDDRVRTRTNYSGGIQGGISNGEDVYFNIAFKPTSTIMRDQESVNAAGESATVKGKGRHDPCVVPRAVPIVEAMAALVMADYWLMAKTDRVSE